MVKQIEDSRQIVLVTAIGTITATAVVLQLKKVNDKYKILGSDINARNEIATSKDVDEFYQFPSAVENEEANTRNGCLLLCRYSTN